MMLDLPGRGRIDWISMLVDMPPTMRPAVGFAFARDRREIEIQGEAVRLTKLEAGLLAALIDRAPAVMTRDELIEIVRRRAFVGSNVIDVVVRSLRGKLGPERRRVESIPKSGHRFLVEPPAAGR